MKEKLSKEFLKILKSISSKRPKTVIDHILEHGQITTEELKNIYGYNHPPRAIRDVREHGIPITTFRITGSDGRRIAAYKFGDPKDVRNSQLSGRTIFSSDLKKKLIDKYGSKCNITLKYFPEKDLQIDHRIPFEIIGDSNSNSNSIDDYMLLCASANRAKSWSCENCPNWKDKSKSVCSQCYWAYPESYTHIATRQMRRIDISWVEDEVVQYEVLKNKSEKEHQELPNFVKSILDDYLKKNS